MNSRLGILRDAVRVAIAGLPSVTSRSITPTASWIPPTIDRDEISEPTVIVAPGAVKRVWTPLSRGGSTETPTEIHVGIFQPLDEPNDSGGEDAGDAIQEIAEQVVSDLISKRYGLQLCVEAEQFSPLDVDMFRTKNLAASVVVLRFKVT